VVTETMTPYREIIVCRHATADELGFGDFDHEPDHEVCDYIRRCSACRADVSETPCPEHAPLHVPGLRLIECAAEPGHGRTWVLDDDGYEPPCPWCVMDKLIKAHEGCEHAGHGRWRRWAVTRRAASRLYGLGVLKGYGIARHYPYCDGCVTHFHWGSNGYLLGWDRWKWRCLLTARHWPGEEIAPGLCGKCAPCPDCGSVTSEHADCPSEMTGAAQ
jgi:hypothetical protein